MNVMESTGRIDPFFWRGKKVLVTGHTGFKGSWLSLWLASLGAEVTGYAMEPANGKDLFCAANIDREMTSIYGDIVHYESLLQVIKDSRPDIILHLAAQSLVKTSYLNPISTFTTNVLGTVHLLEAVRHCDSVRVVINVTSDKCYENTGNPIWGYREDDPMGGHDPYSASKGCAELVTSSYRRSYFQQSTQDSRAVYLASVRAGNVLGGGDWSADRLFPDMMRSIQSDDELYIRNPRATRPWQHVLDPLHGYLLLAEKLWREGEIYSEGWNFGPAQEDVIPVGEVVERVLKLLGSTNRVRYPSNPTFEEALHLKLDSSKARIRLNWKPRLRIEKTIQWTTNWYRSFLNGDDARQLTLEQIHDFMN